MLSGGLVSVGYENAKKEFSMKNLINASLMRLIGIIALVAVIGFGFAACGGYDDEGAVTGVTLNKTRLSLEIGGTETLTATVAPDTATDQEVTWTSSNAAVATVSDGTVTAVKTGNATITVKTTDGNKTATCVVTVTPPAYDPDAADGTTNIGLSGPGGGIIFYYSEEGFTVKGTDITAHYLEVSPGQLGFMRWASSAFEETSITGATGEEIGTGKANTAAILAIDKNAPAAKACNEYSNNGKTDWFLPSRFEQREIHWKKTHLGISSGEFWSSTQFSGASEEYNKGAAISTDFRKNDEEISQFGNGKGNNCYVRAVRAF